MWGHSLNAMEMNWSVERHIIMYCKLGVISTIYIKPWGNIRTSTRSSWSTTNGGPGNWPFMKIISLTFPFGAPSCQVKSNSTGTLAARVLAPKIARQMAKELLNAMLWFTGGGKNTIKLPVFKRQEKWLPPKDIWLRDQDKPQIRDYLHLNTLFFFNLFWYAMFPFPPKGLFVSVYR